jgi:hypothetical protein
MFLLTAATIFGAASISVKSISISSDYKVLVADAETMLAFTTPSTSTINVVVPYEYSNKETFPIGTRIYGTALTDGTLNITGETNSVIIINPDYSFRTRKLGSHFELTKIKRNIWLLTGDLYSLQVDAYIGDDITLKANVDPSATSPLSFVWYKNNVAIPNATNASLKLTNIQTTDNGNYKVTAKNVGGYSFSETTSVIVR